MRRTVDILDGNTFVVSDENGDIDGSPVEPHGLFTDDTRYLSRWVLSIDGERPSVLSVDRTRYYAAQFFLAPGSASAYVNATLAVIRRRTVLEGFHESITVINHDAVPVRVIVRIELDADFADLFEVKDSEVAHKKGRTYRSIEPDRLVLGYQRESYRRETWIRATGDPVYAEDSLRFVVALAPQQSWTTEIDVLPAAHIEELAGFPDGHVWDDPEARLGLRPMRAAEPVLACDWPPLERIYRRSLTDLAALRFALPARPGHFLPAAGLPWFMAAFGRDSIITSLQSLPYLPELAETTLITLGAVQAVDRDDFRDAEPGKIMHELRYGELTAFEERPHSPYYGSADSTTLWLVLLDEFERWTGRADLVRRLEPQARAALRWIDDHGDRDGDGYIEYERRNTDTGLVNQCWKDSGDSIQWADGRIASLPRATCELQGYAYDAKVRCARLAREIWADPALATRLEAEAAALKERFNRDFWLEDRGYYALALDGEKRPVDALASNLGHLLWSGIVPDERIPRVVELLTGERLYSGWGVRTFATGQTGFNPIGYHLGTVWPHDTAIAVAGLVRHGYADEAARISMSMLEAADLLGGRLPEAFAGFPRASTSYPAEYPTACSPQAWAAGAPLMLITSMLGMRPDGAILRSDPHFPPRIRRMRLAHVPGRWGVTDVGADLSHRVLRVGVAPGEVADVLAASVHQFPAELLQGGEASIGFEVEGVGSYRLLMTDGNATLDAAATSADCVVRTDARCLLELLGGTRSFATAMMSDRIRLHGDRLVAIAFFARAPHDPDLDLRDPSLPDASGAPAPDRIGL